MPGIDTGMSVSDVVIAGGGLFTAVTAYLLNRRGQRTAERQSQAAEELSRWAATMKEKDRLIDDYRQRAADAREDATRERRRTERIEHQLEQSRHRADMYRQHLIDVTAVVRDETVRAAALDGVTAEDMPAVPDDDEEDP